MYQSGNISSSEASHPEAVGTSHWRTGLQSTHRKYDASNTPITLQLAEAEGFARGHLGGVKPVILPSAASSRKLLSVPDLVCTLVLNCSGHLLDIRHISVLKQTLT